MKEKGRQFTVTVDRSIVVMLRFRLDQRTRAKWMFPDFPAWISQLKDRSTGLFPVRHQGISE